MASLKPVDVVAVVVDSGVESVVMAITEVDSVVENAAVSEAAIVAGTVVDSVEVIAEATVEVTVEASCYPHSLCSNILILSLLGFRGGRGGGEWRGDGERGRGGRGRGRGDRGGETGPCSSSFISQVAHTICQGHHPPPTPTA